MAAATRILPISNEKFKKTLSWPMSSCASLRVVPRGESKDQVVSRFERDRNSPGATASEHAISVSFSGGVPVFSGIMGDPKTKDMVASLNKFVSGKHAEEGSVVADSPLETIAAALKECGSGRKYKARVVYEDDVVMGTANYPPMVINDGNGKARTMNDVVASSSEHKYGLFGKYAPSASPCEQYPIPVLTAGKGKACIEASPVEYAYYSAAAHRSFGDDLRKAARDAITPAYIGHPSVVYHRAPSRKVQDDIEASPLDAYDIYNGNYSAAARRFYDDFGNAAPSAIALLGEDDDDVIENKRYCCFGGNAAGGSSGEASTSSFKNVKDRDEASSIGSGSIAPKRMKKMDNNFDTGVDCMAGFPGCVPFKFKVWVKRSKDKVYD